MKKRILTQDEAKEIERRRNAGESLATIAMAVGIGRKVVHSHCVSVFGPCPPAKGFESRWTPEMLEKLHKMRWDGMASSEIGDRLGFSKSEINKRLAMVQYPVNPELVKFVHKPLHAPPTERQRRRVNEAKKTPEARLVAKYRHLKHDAADAGEFYHLIALPGYGWPKHGLGSFGGRHGV